ncbi:MAG: hypothetical protein QGF59_24460, partial [Pirellulaceae bacterium]|nr:hypothetical protein [Pirellulaceae bacterium]
SKMFDQLPIFCFDLAATRDPTPKALHIVAQGQRRSRATLGNGNGEHLHAEGVRQSRDMQHLQR